MSNTKIIIFSILLPPLGLLFVWTKTKWGTGAKVLLTALLGFYTLMWFSFLGGFFKEFLK